MAKNRIGPDSNNGAPAPEVRELEPLVRAQLERMLAVRATLLAQQETAVVKKQNIGHQRALLAEREKGLEQESTALDAVLATLREQVVASDAERLQFLLGLGIDPKQFSVRLEEGKLTVTEK